MSYVPEIPKITGVDTSEWPTMKSLDAYCLMAEYLIALSGTRSTIPDPHGDIARASEMYAEMRNANPRFAQEFES